MRGSRAVALAVLVALGFGGVASAAPRRSKAAKAKKEAPPPEPPPPEEDKGPSMPAPVVPEGPLGAEPVDGACTGDTFLVRKGAVLREGPSVTFGVTAVIDADRCLPRMNTSKDGVWMLLQRELGTGGWLNPSAALLEFGNAPVLPSPTALFEVTLLDNAIAHSQPSMLAPVVILLSRGEKLTIHAISDDGLFFQAARDGAPVGWVMKAVTDRVGDPEERPAGSTGWAPAPPDPEKVAPGSPDALNPLPPEPVELALPSAEEAPELDVAGSTEDAVAIGKISNAPPATFKDRIGLLNGRPVGRGLTFGVGWTGGYFYERFQSNAFNDPLGNYRVDAMQMGPALDFSYRAPFGLVIGARYQMLGFSYSDFTPAFLRNLPEPIRPPGRNTSETDLRCPLPLSGQLKTLCPIPSALQSFTAYAGWRLFGSRDMDLDVTMAYSTELLLYGKPTNREPFSDLWYHGLRPTARLLYRPWGGKFGALATEAGMGVGFVIPMVMRPRQACVASKPNTCILRPEDVFEATYVFNPSNGQMIRKGYARPPPFTGLNLKAGYIYEMPFMQVELGLEMFLRYSAIFFTAQEGFGKRNRCCQTGYYDRASTIDVFVGPSVTARAAL